MKKKKTISAVCLLFLLLTVLSGCGKQEETSDAGLGITVATVSESGGLDPAGMIADTYLVYAAAALDELVTFDENGEIVYRAAESYEVNEERTLWTFHLRTDARWSDGSPVTSSDFRNTIERSLNPKSGNGYANYLFCIENAEEIYNGEADMSQLGLETPDDYTISFHLNTPCVYFLDLLRLPVYMPSCSEYADSTDSGWDKNPETSLSNGPFCLKEYVPQQYFVLEKNYEYWECDEISLEEITFRFFDSQQSMAAAYETGEIDVAPGLLDTVMIQYADSPDLVVTDAIATRYIYMNLNLDIFQDERIREALSLGINREELCMAVGNDTEPTVNLVAKYMKDKATGEYFVEESQPPFEEDLERAKQLLAEAGYPDGQGFPELTYSYPSQEQDVNTAQALQQQLKDNLGISLNLNMQERQVNYSERRAGNFELCRMNWTADFSDPDTYLSMLCSNSTYNCSGISDEKYDEIIRLSVSETDSIKRNSLLHEAEEYAVGEQFYIIPLYSMKNVNLVSPEIQGIRQIPATGVFDYRLAYIE